MKKKKNRFLTPVVVECLPGCRGLKSPVLTPGKLKNGEQQIYFHLNIKKGKKINQYFFPLNKPEMTKKIFHYCPIDSPSFPSFPPIPFLYLHSDLPWIE